MMSSTIFERKRAVSSPKRLQERPTSRVTETIAKQQRRRWRETAKEWTTPPTARITSQQQWITHERMEVQIYVSYD